MGVKVRSGAAWRDVIAPGRLMYIRVGGVWKPVLDMWVMGNTPSVPGPAALLLEPFDNLTAWTVPAGGYSIVAGRTGTAAEGAGTSNTAYYPIPAASESGVLTVGFALRVSTLSLPRVFIQLDSDAGSTVHTRAQVNSDGSIGVYRGSSAVLGTTATGLITAGTWYYVELQSVLSDTVGTITLRVNGVTRLNLTAQDTKNGGTKTTFDRLTLFNSVGGTTDWDDLYLTNDGTFLGDITIPPGPVGLAGAVLVDRFNDTNNWTQVSGSSKTMVAGRTGQAVQLDAATGLTYTLPAAAQSDTVTIGFALKIASTIGTANFVYLKSDSGATEHLRFTATLAGAISVSRAGLGGAVSANSVLTVGPWYYVEIQAKLNDTTGFVTVRVNGTQVLSWTAADTKNAGTKTVWDTVQINGVAQTYGVYDDLYILNGATFLGDIANLSPPPSPVADPGWHKVTGYSAPSLVAPTNLRMNPADVNNHSTVPVAWDWTLPTNGLPASNFHVVLTDEAGNWLREMFPTGTTHTFSNVTPNKRYKVYVAAQYAGGGRADTAWVGPLNWFVGQDAYTVNDVPVYGWGGEQEVMPSTYSQSSAANGDYGTWGFQKAQDGNFSSYWNTDVVSPTLDANQGEGFRLWVPGKNYLLNGVRLWNLNYYTVWYGVNLNGGWQGGSMPYSGKYGFLVHGYNAGFNNIFNGDVRSGQYATQGTGAYVDLLLQSPSYDGYDWRFGVVEARLLCQEWIQTGWGPRTIAAINSGYY